MSFKRVSLIIVSFILIILIILFLILYSFINVKLSDLNGQGEIQDTFFSPGEEYKAELFIINKGGATVGDQERVGITSLKDNRKKFNDETVYWMYPAEEETKVVWKSENLIEINGKSINVNDKDTYYNWKKDEDL
ncbi:DUF5412 family protein [Rickettsia conorii]|uniref:DUF5412 family protein n=1 Tax=Rickettsia conorii TaxID=781 RepID=UPI003AEF5DE4